jgi:hypothetical protein
MHENEGRGRRPGTPKNNQESPSPKEQGESRSRVKERQPLRKVLFIAPPGGLEIDPKTRWTEEQEFRAAGRSSALDVGIDNPALKIDLNEGHPGLNEPCVWFVRLQRGAITEEKAREVELHWRQQYKTWEKQKLEKSIKDSERDYTSYVRRFPEKDGQQFKYEIGLKQQELQRRQNKSD